MITIKINQINADEKLLNLSETEEQYEFLFDSIRTHGQLNPLLVIKNEHDYDLLDGFVRFRVMNELGISNCKVIEFEPESIGQSIVLAISSNQGRKWTAWDYINSHNKLREHYPLSQGKRTDLIGEQRYGSTGEIARLVGKSERSLDRLLRIYRFSTELLDLVSVSKITVNQAENVVKALSGRIGENPTIEQIKAELKRLRVPGFENEIKKDKSKRSPSKKVNLVPKPITPYCNQCPYYQELYGTCSYQNELKVAA
jgi:hypothetical protein